MSGNLVDASTSYFWMPFAFACYNQSWYVAFYDQIINSHFSLFCFV